MVVFKINILLDVGCYCRLDNDTYYCVVMGTFPASNLNKPTKNVAVHMVKKSIAAVARGGGRYDRQHYPI